MLRSSLVAYTWGQTGKFRLYLKCPMQMLPYSNHKWKYFLINNFKSILKCMASNNRYVCWLRQISIFFIVEVICVCVLSIGLNSAFFSLASAVQ